MPTLKPLVRKPRPSAPFAVWDVEAQPRWIKNRESGKLELEPVNTEWLGAGVYDGSGNGEIFESQDRFFAYLLSDKFEGYWLYAHNASGYDLRYLIAYLCRKRIPWEAFTAGSRWFLRVADREFLDSMAVLPMSLREAAKKLGAKFQKHDVNKDFFRTIAKHWREGRAKDYLRGDLLALYESVAIMRQAVEALGGQLKRTLASTAVDLWQRCYLDGEYEVPEWDHPAEAAAREAYAGGRCEVFQGEIGKGEYWDRNSSYPMAMLEPVPVEALDHQEGGSIPDSGLVLGVFDIPHEDQIPGLFYRHNGRLYHPTGKFSGWRTADECRYVRELYGTKAVKVKESIPFLAHDIFSAYVHDLYAKRLIPGPVGVVAKRLLTNLYGRTGMVREREVIKCGPAPDYDVAWIDRDRYSVWTETDTEVMKHNATIMPAVAATITGRGRIALHRQLRKAPDPAYCDTDSVVTGGELPEEPSLEIGAWKIELRFKRARFIAPKAYRIEPIPGASGSETVLHAKGMPRKDIKLVSDYLERKKVTVGRVPGIRESMKRGLDVDGAAENQTRENRAKGNRHEDGRAFKVSELV